MAEEIRHLESFVHSHQRYAAAFDILESKSFCEALGKINYNARSVVSSKKYKVYYYENTEGGHSAAANLNEAARRSALEYVYLSQKLMD